MDDYEDRPKQDYKILYQALQKELANLRAENAGLRKGYEVLLRKAEVLVKDSLDYYKLHQLVREYFKWLESDNFYEEREFEILEAEQKLKQAVKVE